MLAMCPGTDQVRMRNDSTSTEALKEVVAEIFHAAVASDDGLSLGALLKAYDGTITKHGISASDLAGIQIYRLLLQWSREQNGDQQANQLVPVQASHASEGRRAHPVTRSKRQSEASVAHSRLADQSPTPLARAAPNAAKQGSCVGVRPPEPRITNHGGRVTSPARAKVCIPPATVPAASARARSRSGSPYLTKTRSGASTPAPSTKSPVRGRPAVDRPVQAQPIVEDASAVRVGAATGQFQTGGSLGSTAAPPTAPIEEPVISPSIPLPVACSAMVPVAPISPGMDIPLASLATAITNIAGYSNPSTLALPLQTSSTVIYPAPASFAATAPLQISKGVCSTGAEDDVNLVLARAFNRRRTLRRFARRWRSVAKGCENLRRIHAAQCRSTQADVLSAWFLCSKDSISAREAFFQRVEERRRSAIENLSKNACVWFSRWRAGAGRQQELSSLGSDVRRRRLIWRLRGWQAALRENQEWAVHLRQNVLNAWRQTARKDRQLHQATQRWQVQVALGFCRSAFRQLRHASSSRRACRAGGDMAAKHGRMHRLRDAVHRWLARARRRRDLSVWWQDIIIFSRRRACNAALEHWSGVSARNRNFKSATDSLHVVRRNFVVHGALSFWNVRYTVLRRRRRKSLARLRGSVARREVEGILALWQLASQRALRVRRDTMRRRDAELLQVTWHLLQARFVERKLQRVYKDWAEVHWARNALSHCWVSWQVWLSTSQKLPPASSSEAHLMSVWRWLRSCFSPALVPGTHWQSVDGDSSDHLSWVDPVRRRVAGFALFYGQFPIWKHARRLAIRGESVLETFAAALLRRLIRSWTSEVNRLRVFRLEFRVFSLWRVFGAWNQFTRQHRVAAGNAQKVIHRLATGCRRRHVAAWRRAADRRRAVRLGSEALELRAIKRFMRKSFAAWRAIRSWQVRAGQIIHRLGRRQAMRYARDIFEALVFYRREIRHAEALRHLADLFFRKNGLRQGIRNLIAGVRERHAKEQAEKNRLSTLQRSWLRRWRERRLARAELANRIAAARLKANAELLARTWCNWVEACQWQISQRNLVAMHQRSVRSHDVARCLRRWNANAATGRLWHRTKVIAFGQARSQQVKRYICWWRRRGTEGAKLRRSLKAARAERIVAAITTWRHHLEASRSRNACLIAALVVLRFRHIVRAWRQEVVLSHLIRKVIGAVALKRAKFGIRTLRTRTKRRRKIRGRWILYAAEVATRLFVKSVEAWTVHTQLCRSWRECADVARDTAGFKTVHRCLKAWRLAAARLRELKLRGLLVGDLLGRRRAATLIHSMRYAARASHLASLSAQETAKKSLAVILVAWRGMAKDCGRCHRASIAARSLLRLLRARSALRNWKAIGLARKAIESRLVALIIRRSQRIQLASAVLWRYSAIRSRACRSSLARAMALARLAMQRVAIRRFALWCVRCAAREAALSHALELSSRAVTRFGFRRYASAVAKRRAVAERKAAAEGLRSWNSCRRGFDAWVRAWLLHLQEASLEAAAAHFRGRTLGTTAWIAWTAVAERERDNRVREATAKDLAIAHERRCAVRVWVLHLKAQRENKSRYDAAQNALQRLSCARALRNWRHDVCQWRALHFRVEECTRRLGFYNADSRSPSRKLRARTMRAAATLSNAVAQVRVWSGWKILRHWNAMRAEEISKILVTTRERVKFTVRAYCFQALHAYTTARSTKRSEIASALLQSKLLRLLASWARVVRRDLENRRAFNSRQLMRKADVIRDLLEKWTEHCSTWMRIRSAAAHVVTRRRERMVLAWLEEFQIRTQVKATCAILAPKTLLSAIEKWQAFCGQRRRQRVAVARAIYISTCPVIRAWRSFLLLLRIQRVFARAIARRWCQAARSQVARRKRCEALVEIRRVRCKILAIRRFAEFRVARQRYRPSRRPKYHAIVSFWGRWRTQIAESQNFRRRRKAAQNWVHRSQMLIAIASLRVRALHARSLKIRCQVLEQSRKSRRTARGWLDWRMWLLVRARRSAFASAPRGRLRLLKQVFSAWRILILAVYRTQLLDDTTPWRHRLRVPWRAWSGVVARKRLARNAQTFVALRQMRKAMFSWWSVVTIVRQVCATVLNAYETSLRSLSMQVFTAWHRRRQWKQHLRSVMPAIKNVVTLTLLSRVFPQWQRVCHVLRMGKKLERARTQRLVLARFREWRRAALLLRLVTVRMKIERRLLNEGMKDWFSSFVSRHEALQVSMDNLLDTHPGVWPVLAEAVARCTDEQKEALSFWHGWTKRRKRLRERFSVASTETSHRKMSYCMSSWIWFQRRSAKKIAYSRMVADFRKADAGGLRLAVLSCWTENVRRCLLFRHKEQGAASFCCERKIVKSFGRWWVWARRERLVKVAETTIFRSRAKAIAWKTLKIWTSWRQTEQMVRETLEGLTEEREHKIVLSFFTKWRTGVARLLGQAARRETQVEQIRQQLLWKALTSAFTVWSASSAAARWAANENRKRKAFSCWQLLAQEQRLLRRYLTECSSAGFQGSAHPTPGDCSVQQADFERLYSRLAAQRWEGNGGGRVTPIAEEDDEDNDDW